MARPTKPVDVDLIRRLALVHCSNEEIASVVGVHKRTLERRYAAVIEDGRREGKTSLRRVMWKKALEGNERLMIWLSKQHLDMREPKDEETMRAIRNVLEHRPYQALPADKLVKAIEVLSEAPAANLPDTEPD